MWINHFILNAGTCKNPAVLKLRIHLHWLGNKINIKHLEIVDENVDWKTPVSDNPLQVIH